MRAAHSEDRPQGIGRRSHLRSVGGCAKSRLAVVDDRDRSGQPSAKTAPAESESGRVHPRQPRPEIDSTRITLALDVLESPWPLREEMMLREWFKDETRAGTAKSAYLIEKILATWLEPFREPPTLAPSRVEKVELVCCRAVSWKNPKTRKRSVKGFWRGATGSRPAPI